MYAHGITQGAITAAQGGKFQHGFFSAAFSAGAEGFTSKINSNAGKVAASSVVGGTASALGGGKFANGAITGAYVMLFTIGTDGTFQQIPPTFTNISRNFTTLTHR